MYNFSMGKKYLEDVLPEPPEPPRDEEADRVVSEVSQEGNCRWLHRIAKVLVGVGQCRPSRDAAEEFGYFIGCEPPIRGFKTPLDALEALRKELDRRLEQAADRRYQEYCERQRVRTYHDDSPIYTGYND